MKRLTCLLLTLALLLSGCSFGPLEDLRSAISSNAWNKHFETGSTYLENKQYPEAVEAFSEAIDTDPNRAEAYISRGDAYIQAAEALLNNPSGTLLDIFNDSEKASEYMDKAREDYKTALELAPELHGIITEKIDHLDAIDAVPIQ